MGLACWVLLCNLNTVVDSAAHSKGLVRRLKLEKLHVPAGFAHSICQARLVSGTLAGLVPGTLAEEMLHGAPCS